jgi:hypothetical protein
MSRLLRERVSFAASVALLANRIDRLQHALPDFASAALFQALNPYRN